jgi:hypothetical protein
VVLETFGRRSGSVWRYKTGDSEKTSERRMNMNTCDFRVILANKTDLTLEDADPLYEAGCDDATFGGCDGIVFGDFHRTGDSLDEAVRSAIADTAAAGFRVSRIEIDADSLVPQQS